MNLKQKVYLSILFPIFFIILSALISMAQIDSLLSDSDWVTHTHNVISKANSLKTLVVKLETGQRGFIITGEEKFLDPYKDARALWDNSIKDLKITVSDNPYQVKALDAINGTLYKWLKVAGVKEINVRKERNFDSARELILKETGKELTDELNNLITRFIDVEIKLLKQRNDQKTKSVLNIKMALILFCFLALISCVIFGYKFNSYLENSIEDLKLATQNFNTDGDIELIENKSEDEFGELNESFNKMAEIINEKSTHLTLALEGSNLGIWEWSIDENKVNFDKRWASMLGLSEDKLEMDLDQWQSRIHPEDFAECFLDITSFLEGHQKAYQNVHRMRHEKGYWVYVLDQGKVSKTDEFGKPICFTGTQLDISFQKEQELKLKEEKLKAQIAEKAKTEFLANMSHEIRTPMNGVLGMVQLLSETNLSIEQRDLVETTRNCGNSLLAILNDILDFSKIESGKLELEIVEFNFKRCIDEAIFLLSYKASQKGIDLRFQSDVSEDKLWYKGDVTRIRQIIVNFISNAVKFTEEGEVVVILETETKDIISDEINIKVKDTGIGIKKEAIGRLFKDFSQADTSTTRKFGGTGLGLSISAKLVKLMNGNIGVQSKYGEGSTFSFSLILIKADKKSTSEKVDAKESSLSNLSQKYPHKILVVEDNAINQKLAKMMLKKLGYECDIAANGIEAIEMIKSIDKSTSRRYSITFMDMQMPEMDGVTATKILRSKYNQITPPIVAVTANAFVEDKNKCLEAGMVDFVPKPIQISELRRVLIKFSKESSKVA